ncbi:MAG: ATP-dependent helicase HrpB [Rhodobacteraceae bacterium]|nr:ATP-dependent helicase HrpB [Paracoccaceae bacterium]
MIATLPIDAALPALLDALRASGLAVLEAPPGAGKTTGVPMALLASGLVAGRILMLEPRRIAARAAAERIAEMLGEPVGQRVGYRIRGETQVSKATRIEVVTEGILTRMLQRDPGLEGVGAVIFDEFHERSLNADLGLALCLEVRGALREDLMLLVMSATLDGAAVADLMGGAPVIRSEGRAYPVDTHWLDAPPPKTQRLEAGVADLVRRAVAETEGGVLVFLPGEGEIRRVASLLDGTLPAPCALRPLFGAMPFADQRAAIRPDASARKIVLATSIAETSLTIEDIRVVVDAGRARRARFEPGAGMARLVTEPVSRAEADQRRGRAGRVAPGVCYRMWTRGAEGALPAFAPAEIEVADLAGLALDLAQWGARGASELAFLTPPGDGAFAAAQRLLGDLGALDESGAITGHGRALAALPLHPRLAHMLVVAGRPAAPLAALLAERDPLRDAGVDLSRRLEAMTGGPVPPAARDAFARIREEAKRLARLAGPEARALTPAQMAALAYPDRIGLRRPGDDPRWVMSGGKGVRMRPEDALAGARLIVVTDTDGHPREATVRQAIAIDEGALRDVLGDRIGWQTSCDWSRREGRVLARQQERLGALVLDDRVWRDAPPEALARAMADGVRALGLNWTDAARRFRARVMLVRATGADLPDMSDEGLMARLDDWLLPHLGGLRSAADWKRFDMTDALRASLSWDQMQAVDRAAPAQFTTPLGRKLPIDYAGEAPEIAVRLQEMFGLTAHPQVAGAPLRIALLSPAGRPVQVTMDLPGFWASSYADVRKDMRGRYPKHPWPEDPTTAPPTTRAKPRK